MLPSPRLLLFFPVSWLIIMLLVPASQVSANISVNRQRRACVWNPVFSSLSSLLLSSGPGCKCLLLWVLLGGCASFLLGLEAVMAAGVGLEGLPVAAFWTKGKQDSASRSEGPMGTERTCGPRWTEESVYSKGCGSAELCRGMEVGGEGVCTCLIWAGQHEPGTWGAQEPGPSLIFLSSIGLLRAVGFISQYSPRVLAPKFSLLGSCPSNIYHLPHKSILGCAQKGNSQETGIPLLQSAQRNPFG